MTTTKVPSDGTPRSWHCVDPSSIYRTHQCQSAVPCRTFPWCQLAGGPQPRRMFREEVTWFWVLFPPQSLSHCRLISYCTHRHRPRCVPYRWWSLRIASYHTSSSSSSYYDYYVASCDRGKSTSCVWHHLLVVRSGPVRLQHRRRGSVLRSNNRTVSLALAPSHGVLPVCPPSHTLSHSLSFLDRPSFYYKLQRLRWCFLWTPH